MEDSDKKLHVCAACNEIFDTEESLSRHFVSCEENKPVMCKMLEKTFSGENEVTGHREKTQHVDQTDNPVDCEQLTELEFLGNLFLVKEENN